MIVKRTVDCFQSEAECHVKLRPLHGYYDFRQLNREDFFTSPVGQQKKRAEIYEARLGEGHEAWGYIDKAGKIACYLWLTMDLHKSAIANFECGLLIEIPAQSAYIWDCRSDPAHQERGLYRHGLQSLRDMVAGRGASEVLIVTRRENNRSADSIEKVGFGIIGTLQLYAFRGIVMMSGSSGLKLLRTHSMIHFPKVS